MIWPLTLKKPGLWDHGMAFDIRVQNVLEKKPGLTDQGVATGVTKFCKASGRLILLNVLRSVIQTFL